MKKYLFGLLVILGFGFSFSSAGSYTYNGSISNFSKTYYNNLSCSSVVSIPILKSSTIPYNSNFSFNYNCSISNQNINTNGTFGVSISYYNISSASFSTYNISDNPLSSSVPSSNLWYYINICFKKQNSGQETVNLTFDWSCTFSGDDLLDDSSSSCDYSQYETEIQTLSGNLATCQSNYSSCQSNYSSCQSDYSICNSSLTSCQSSLSGYDNTLNNCSTNLNSCNSSLSQCLQANCPSSNTGNIQWSSIYINDIQHLGAGIIDITIPEEIHWDYLNQNDVFSLDVEGYNVDSDFIQSVIDVQNYQPTTSDLTNIFALFKEYAGLLVSCLFVIFVFYLIKKSF